MQHFKWLNNIYACLLLSFSLQYLRIRTYNWRTIREEKKKAKERSCKKSNKVYSSVCTYVRVCVCRKNVVYNDIFLFTLNQTFIQVIEWKERVGWVTLHFRYKSHFIRSNLYHLTNITSSEKYDPFLFLTI
jgi:hypothetical protein